MRVALALAVTAFMAMPPSASAQAAGSPGPIGTSKYHFNRHTHERRMREWRAGDTNEGYANGGYQNGNMAPGGGPGVHD